MKRFLETLCVALALLLALTALAETPDEAQPVELPETELSALVEEEPPAGEPEAEPEIELPCDEQPGEPGPAAPEEAIGTPPEVPPPSGNITALTLGLKETYAWKVGADGDGVAWTFSTSNRRVATVSAAGVITARKKGSATITAKASTGEQVSCQVKVLKAPKRIALSAASATLGYDAATGTGTQLALGVAFPRGTGAQVRFSGYDSRVVRVSADGVVTACGVGTTTVTASTFNKKRARCTVTVLGAPESVAFAEAAPAMIERERRVLALNAAPANTAAIARFASDNTAVAKVNASTGEVTAVAIGEATITATAFNGRTASCTVSVLPGPDRIALPASRILLGQGEQLLLGATPVRSDGSATGTGLSYASSRTKYVAVGADGTLTGRKRGSAVVTVSAANGVKASCTVKVVKAPKSVRLTADHRMLQFDPNRGIAEQARLRAVLPRNTASAVAFSGYDPAVVSVSASGTVTPTGVGSTLITAKTFNGKTASFRITVYAPGRRTGRGTTNVAHRGGKGNWPENSLEAFRNAAATGAKAVELDARSTKDGVQVVHHDRSLAAGGRYYAIRDLTLAQVRRLKPGICTLDEALDVIQATGLELVLEMKETANAKACVQSVSRHGLKGRTTYISFHAQLLKQVHALDRAAPLGYLINKTPSGLGRTLKSIGAKSILQKADYLTADNLFNWQDAGYKVGIWTVNDAADIRKWLDYGVDYITSDYPRRVTDAMG